MTQQIDRNAEYAIGWELYCAGIEYDECVNEYQRQGWNEARYNNVQINDRKWAQNWGKEDGSKGEPFFPEQVGQWLRLDYAEGFQMAQPDNESAKFWLAREYRRIDAEEDEMNWRETIIHAGGRFIGASLEEART